MQEEDYRDIDDTIDSGNNDEDQPQAYRDDQ